VRLASAPAPVAVPRPKNALTAEPVVGVHVQALPVSEALTVFDAVAPVSVKVAVDGAHETVPWSPVRVVAFVQSVVRLAEKVPVPSFSLRAIEPEALAVEAPNVEPVPLTFASSERWWCQPSCASAAAGTASAPAASSGIMNFFMWSPPLRLVTAFRTRLAAYHA